MKGTYENKNILVTGGCGSIGKEIIKSLTQFKPKLIRVLDHNEEGHFKLEQEFKNINIEYVVGEIHDKETLNRTLDGINIVFHAAALKHVNLCEQNPTDAVKVNIIGTQRLLDASVCHGVEKFIGISTDKAVNPISTMGATKLLGEKVILNTYKNSKTKCSVVRFGNVLNSSGSVIPIFKEQLRLGQDLTVTSKDMVRFYLPIKDAIKLVLTAGDIMNGQEIFILKMNRLKIMDLAKVMKDNLGTLGTKINIIGIRDGEKLDEYLMTVEEATRAYEHYGMYIVSKDHSGVLDINKINKTHVLTKEELKQVLIDNDIISNVRFKL